MKIVTWLGLAMSTAAMMIAATVLLREAGPEWRDSVGIVAAVAAAALTGVAAISAASAASTSRQVAVEVAEAGVKAREALGLSLWPENASLRPQHDDPGLLRADTYGGTPYPPAVTWVRLTDRSGRVHELSQSEKPGLWVMPEGLAFQDVTDAAMGFADAAGINRWQVTRQAPTHPIAVPMVFTWMWHEFELLS